MPESLVPATPSLGRQHWQRLRRMYRSAGWPCHDSIELDLLAAGMLERVLPASGVEYLRVSDAGIRRLAEQRQGHRRALSAHAALVERVAAQLAQQGRLCFAELTLRARPDEQWREVRPDLFSIRRTSRAAYLQPVVHEIKVRRADLLADLKKPDKHRGYLAIAGSCYYVLSEGIGTADDIPESCGVVVATDKDLKIVRAAPAQAVELRFDVWMALARAVPIEPPTGQQQWL